MTKRKVYPADTVIESPRPLTLKQRQIWEYIAGRIVRTGGSPTIREIMTEFGIVSPNGMMCHLRALVQKGWIERVSSESRGIRVPGLAAYLAPAATAYLSDFRPAQRTAAVAVVR